MKRGLALVGLLSVIAGCATARPTPSLPAIPRLTFSLAQGPGGETYGCLSADQIMTLGRWFDQLEQLRGAYEREGATQ